MSFRYIVPLFFVFVLSCCQSIDEGAYPLIATAAGAAAGYSVDDGSRRGAVGGAAVGYLVGEGLKKNRKNQTKKIYTEGYQKGRSDAVKNLYWAQRNSHKPFEEGGGVERRLYEIPIPQHITRDGVLVESHNRVVEVVE